MSFKRKNIGFFDSGIGGISVLKNSISILPNESFVYFGDSKNSPYGSKLQSEIIRLSLKICNFLIYENNCKAIVVACNTASSASINFLREKYEPAIPIIGVEPAIKPSIKYIEENNLNGKILVLATPFTILGEKFKNLLKIYEKFNVKCVPLKDLAYMIEFNFNRNEIKNYLITELKDHLRDTSSIVLGCTHYYFVKDILKEIFHGDVKIFDGGEGTSAELNRRLILSNIKNCESVTKNKNVFIYNSLGYEGVKRSYELLNS